MFEDWTGCPNLGHTPEWYSTRAGFRGGGLRGRGNKGGGTNCQNSLKTRLRGAWAGVFFLTLRAQIH